MGMRGVSAALQLKCLGLAGLLPLLGLSATQEPGARLGVASSEQKAMAVNTDCQLYRIYSHRGNKSLGTPVRNYS